MAQPMSCLCEKLYFNNSGRTVLVCLSQRAENFFRGWEMSDSSVPAQVQQMSSSITSPFLCRIKLLEKVPSSTHPYACSGLCLLLSEYHTCLWPTGILVDFWHDSPKIPSVSFSYLSGVQSLAGTPEHCLSLIHKLLETHDGGTSIPKKKQVTKTQVNNQDNFHIFL